MEFCRKTTKDSKEEVRNAWNDGRSTRNQNFAPRNQGKTMTEEPEERCKKKKERKTSARIDEM